MSRDSLLFALANKELARLHALLTNDHRYGSYSTRREDNSAWAREQIAKFHKALTADPSKTYSFAVPPKFKEER